MSEDYRTPLSQWPTRSLNFVWGRILPHVLGVGRAGHHFFFVWGDQKSSWGRFFPSGDLFFRKYQRIKMCGDYGNIVWGSRKQLSVSVGTNKILCGVWGAPYTSFFCVGKLPTHTFFCVGRDRVGQWDRGVIFASFFGQSRVPFPERKQTYCSSESK